SSDSGKDKEKPKEQPKAPPKPDLPKVFIDEDFRTPYEKKLTLPEGWESDAFRIVKENELHGLEVSKPKDVQYVKLPPLTLIGNFYLEGVYHMDRPEFANYHTLRILLENPKRGAPLLVVFDWQGKILNGDDPRLPPPGYKPLLPTHFLLKREGK